MRRGREEEEEAEENLRVELVKRVKDVIPFRVGAMLTTFNKLVTTLVHRLVTGQFDSVAKIFIESVFDDLVVYHLYLILKEMENPVIVWDTDEIFRKFDIWNSKLKKLIGQHPFGPFVDAIRAVTGRNEYSPRWLYWSVARLVPLIDRRNTNAFVATYTFNFEHKSNRNDVVTISYNPSRQVVQFQKPTETDTFTNILAVSNHTSSFYTVKEFKVPPLIFDPAGPNLSVAVQVAPYLYQLFATGYLLTDYEDPMYASGEMLMIGNNSNCTVCNKKAILKCNKVGCSNLKFCSEQCHDIAAGIKDGPFN